MTAGPQRMLVTGAGGSVGANLVRRLAGAGHEVTAIVRPGGDLWRLDPAGADDPVADVALAPVDLGDRAAVDRVVGEIQPRWAFHLAAHGAYSWQTDAHEIFRTNVLGTVNLVEACRAGGCEALVNAGSSSEYGYKDHPPDEHEPLEPASEYAAAKAAATLYCRQVARESSLRVVTLRLYSVYGPWDDPGRLVPKLAAMGLRGELPPLADPEVARDFVAMDDVLDAFVLAAERTGLPPGAVYNVGTGRQTSMREMVEVTREALGIAAEPEWGTADRRRWDTSIWVARVDRIERELGWRPRIELDDGFRRAADWLRATPSVWSAYGVSPPP